MPNVMWKIKICGLTTIEDALAAAEAGADAVGLNFHPPSPRCVSVETAANIAAALPSSVCKVGVFVNLPATTVLEIASSAKLDWLQLHGDEPPEMLGSLSGWPVLRAFRCREEAGVSQVADYLQACRTAGRTPDAVLADAYQEGCYGGSGKTVSWELARRLQDHLQETPLVLAGGLTAENVAQAISEAAPQAVDTASGVESSPGVKSADKMRAFAQQAAEAFPAT